MKKYYEIKLKDASDIRGNLTIAEVDNQIPFLVKRIFYSYNTKSDELRGQHANINSKFMMISVAGSCKVKVDDGIMREEFILDHPNKALYLDKMTWKDMYEFSSDNILLILSDCVYDAKEYIRDYEEFRNMISER
ncbi:MAG: uncharacterized protein K0Q49_2326 [Haloplasmataceae bacterium]|nr:uncharacterized protein [Haloplasmataceae bacterium]